jgi:hypothetical protein
LILTCVLKNLICDFLTKWNKLYEKQDEFERNQPSFRKALFESDIQLLPLPREYNYRLPKIAEVHDKVKIIHGRHPVGYDKIDDCINSKLESRVISRTDWPLDITSINDISIKFMILYILNSGDIHNMADLIKTKWNNYSLSEIINRISL